MLPEVEENVDEAIAHFARRGEGARMIAIAPDGTPAAPDAIEGACCPAGEAVETAAQLVGGARFYEQVNVVGLDGEVHDAESVGGRARE